MQRKKKEKLAKKEEIENIDEMPDCLRKFEMIKLKSKADPTWKFTDAEFSHANEQQVLGDTVFCRPPPLLKHGVVGWKRASEMDGAELFMGSADCRDVEQGKIGDCYLLSAFSVLGNERIRELFCEDVTEENKDWKKLGCFVVKIPGGGRADDESIVIVDDYLPVNEKGKIQFARGGVNGLELWPAILEKAYAKLYGSYSAIIGGKVHVALGDLVENGFPE